MIDAAAPFVDWNFGDAEEEAAAISSGNRHKVQKVATKVQKERLLISDPKKLDNDKNCIVPGKALLDNIQMPFLGTVSTLRARGGLKIGELFGMPWFVNPPPAVSPASRTIIPAWLVGVTHKPDQGIVGVEKRVVTAVPVLIE